MCGKDRRFVIYYVFKIYGKYDMIVKVKKERENNFLLGYINKSVNFIIRKVIVLFYCILGIMFRSKSLILRLE